MTAKQREAISSGHRVRHGLAVIAGTRVPVSVILDGLAADMTAEEITAEYPKVSTACARAAVLADHRDCLTGQHAASRR